MPLPLNDDLAAIMNVDEFASSATYIADNFGTKTAINGIFDNETIPVDGGGIVQVHHQQPRFTCRTSDVPNVSEDDLIVIGSTEYRIVAWVHDGTGVTTLQLEKR